MWYKIRKVLCAVKGQFTRLFFVRQMTITRGLAAALIFSVASLLFLSYYVSNNHFTNVSSRTPPQPTVKCRANQSRESLLEANPPKDHSSSASLRLHNKVLVFVETQYSKRGVQILALLEANRIKFKFELAGKSLPFLTKMDKGKYGVIIFENLQSYLNMDQWNRQLLDKYCREYRVGIISFTYPTTNNLINAPLKDMQMLVHTNLALKDYEINPKSNILRLTRAGEVLHGFLPGDDWSVFVPNHTTYEPLAYARTQSAEQISLSSSMEEVRYIPAIQDLGLLDGIQRVIFGSDLNFWLHGLLFIDALSYLSHGKFSVPLDRHVQIDVDDIFVGRQGIRLVPSDIQALVKTQQRMQEYIPDFHFNLGFSGKFYHRGSPEENRGDDALLANSDEFYWFAHSWGHTQPHNLDNISDILDDMLLNAQFAKEHGIVVNNSYAVAPHHSGVFPVHEQLYEAWKRVWDVRVTSTEEYPHLRPARKRKGFIHRGIMVLPRQTCGLFTHNVFIDKYPGGRYRLDESIRGGELFQTIVNNPILIFMTHMSNYGNDRLALYTFESVFKFIRCWTNLRLISVPPLKLGRLYFQMYPEERDPVWRNPCHDKRHLAIWSENKKCSRLPHFLVIGPQKTGTTALYTFLTMHPAIISNLKSRYTFEEVQFFNGRNYYYGLDWYMSFYPTPNSTTTRIFEKSANYFDNEDAPRRAHALLPEAKLICILVDPAKRAHSWYQHVRAHEDPVAVKYSFYEIITAGDDAPRAVRDIRNRCLYPGMYAQHMERWLTYYTASQLLILDGEQLKLDPTAVMDRVQVFIQAEPYFDYSTRLKFSPKKGFYCQILNGDHTKCLGRNKGRIYPPMEVKAEKYLQTFYRHHNILLSKLLSRLGQPIPQWLSDELSDVH